MDDFLINEEEKRISNFGRTVSDALKNGIDSTKEVKVSNKRKNNKRLNEEVDGLSSNKESFVVRVDKGLEIPIRKAILNIYEKSGKKTSIRDFIGEAISLYLKQFK